jgi:alpha-glucuronidase|mmetsp:Transcript_79556/g.133275  ORF Transcript_79556/g.133275 Transcript_79556/m.133275 type:complete len:124 (+) Transcript_79556:78-449(+)
MAREILNRNDLRIADLSWPMRTRAGNGVVTVSEYLALQIGDIFPHRAALVSEVSATFRSHSHDHIQHHIIYSAPIGLKAHLSSSHHPHPNISAKHFAPASAHAPASMLAQGMEPGTSHTHAKA